MEQHPIPTNITSYEFRLVGDMTLKQFLALASGIVVGLVIFRLPLPGIFKYPLIALSVTTGILMAFVPVNGRPFTTWLVAFFRAVYAPTQFIWKAPAAAPVSPAVSAPPPPAAPLSSLPSPAGVSGLAASGKDQVSPGQVAKTAPFSLPPPDQKPSPPASTQTQFHQISTPPPSPPPPAPPPSPAQSQVKAGPAPDTAEIFVTPAPAPKPDVSAGPPPLPPLPPPRRPAPPPPAGPAATTTQVTPPVSPNILTGLVTGPGGNALEGVIIEIVDTATGIPARALRTNRTGLFQIATPLSPGTYSLTAEKEGFSFDPVAVTVKNAVIPPVIISAKTAPA